MASETASELASVADWNAAREASFERPVLVYKHSATCPTSAWAQRNIDTWSDDHADWPVYRVTVQSARPVSNQIADDLSLRHETPQAIIVHKGEVIEHLNHNHVTPDRLTEALRKLDLPV
ncbi:MAG: bacillithiol system redox-active protein YtxJ [Longimonas sp.]|uniref:bacillithiol system redox-active protein YtxJ n=1 Tax=Longimonas sp. TaxID=2039626 RepID=UPI003975F036